MVYKTLIGLIVTVIWILKLFADFRRWGDKVTWVVHPSIMNIWYFMYHIFDVMETHKFYLLVLHPVL